MTIYPTQKGFSLIETVLAGALFALCVFLFTNALLTGQENTRLAGTRTRAGFIAHEGLEAARAIRDEQYTALTDGVHGLSQSQGHWIFSGSQDSVDQFTRTITVAPYNQSTKEITTTVSWQQNLQRTGSVSLSTYLSDWSQSAGSWASPLLDASFDLTVSNSGNNTANARSVTASSTTCYLGRDNGGGKEFFIFDCAAQIPQLTGQRDLNGDPNDIAIRDNYAYVASTDNSSELQIIDITNPATIAQAGKLTSIDLTDSNSGDNNANALALGVSGNYLYMIRDGGDEFLIFDLSNPSNPGNPVGRLGSIVGTPTDITFSGDYAIITSDANTEEVQVIDIANKNAPVKIASLDLNNGNAGANAISIAAAHDSYVLVGRTASAAPELYALSISDTGTPTLVATFEVGDNITSIAYSANWRYAFLVTGDASDEIKVIDANSLPTLQSPPPLGHFNVANAPRMIMYSDTTGRAYIAGTNDSQELQILTSQ